MQQVQLGLRIIKNSSDFENGIEQWYERPVVEHTWDNFKTHFEEAREKLKKIRGSDMRNSAFKHANFVANEVRADIARTHDSIMQALAGQTNETEEEPEPELDKGAEQANATMQDATQLAILQLLKQIQADMKQNKPQKQEEVLLLDARRMCAQVCRLPQQTWRTQR